MKKSKIKCRAYGKVNLSLNITGVQSGMHTLDMVVASADVFDEITISERYDSNVNVEFSCGGVDKTDNTVTKTINAIARRVGKFGCDIFVEKNVPLSGGMGGSSVDCAGVLTAVNSLYDFKFDKKTFNDIALDCGSDVPYMCSGGFARVQGFGGNVEFIESETKLYMVIAQSGGSGVNSGECYKKFDELNDSKSFCPSDNDKLIGALVANDKAMFDHFDNALFKSSVLLCSEIENVLSAIKQTNPIAAVMTGSGSVCVGYYGDMDSAHAAQRVLSGMGLYAKAIASKNVGVELL